MASKAYCQKIAEGILDEIKAQITYDEMIKIAPSNTEKRALQKIKKDESQHMRELWELFEECTVEGEFEESGEE